MWFMAVICEIGSRFQIGRFRIGRKLDPIPPTQPPRTVCLSSEDNSRFEEQRTFWLAVIKGPDRVRLAISNNGITYKEYGDDIVGLAINRHPALAGKLRFNPTVPVSVFVPNTRKLQLPENL